MAPSAASKLNHLYGVKAWRSWVQQRNKQPQKCKFFSSFLINFLLNLHCLRFTFILPVTADPVEVKEDVLDCNSAELSFGLSCFIKEVRRPNGEPYSPDSIFYLCLGIQQVPTKNCTTGFHHVSLCFFLKQPSLSPTLSVWTASVYDGSHREHLHRPAVQSVCLRDLWDASTLETKTTT